VAGIPGGRYFDLDWSPDGERVATITTDGALRVYAWPALELLVERSIRDPGARLKFNYHCRSVCFSEDGRELTTAGAYDDARVWDAATLEPRGSWSLGWPDRWTERLRRGPSGVVVACGNSSRVQVYDVASKRPLWGPVVTAFRWNDGKRWFPADCVMDWLGDDLVLNTSRGTWVLDLEQRVSQELAPNLAGEQLLVGGAHLYWRNQGRVYWAEALRGDSGLRLTPLQTFDGPPISDMVRVDDDVFLLGEQQGGLEVFRKTPGGFEKRSWATYPGAHPKFGESSPGSGRLWVHGDEQILAVSLAGQEVRGRPVAQRPRILTQVGPSGVLSLDRAGDLNFMDFEQEAIATLARGINPVDIRLLDEGHVAIGAGTKIQVLEVVGAKIKQELHLPPGRLLSGFLPSPKKDAIYVWTARGSVYRYDLYR